MTRSPDNYGVVSSKCPISLYLEYSFHLSFVASSVFFTTVLVGSLLLLATDLHEIYQKFIIQDD